MEPTWHFLLACVLSALLLGFLLAEWTYQRLLDKANEKLADVATTIEDLVTINDGCDQLITQLQNNINLMDENIEKLLLKNSNQFTQIQQLESLLNLPPEN